MVLPDGRVESCGNFHGAPLAFACRRARDRHRRGRRDRRAPHRPAARRVALVRPAAVPRPGRGRQLRAHDRPVHAGGDGRREPPPRGAGERRLAADERDAGGPRLDGLGGGAQAAHVVDNLARILAVELVCAARGIELRAPLAPAAGTGAALAATPRGRRRRRRARTAGWRPSCAAAERLVRSGALLPRCRRDRGAGMTAGARPVRAARGTELSCQGWPQEAALRMLMQQPRPRGRRAPRRPRRLRRHRPRRPLVGGLRRDRRARCARSQGDETLLVQSGKPVGVFRTHEWAPRVLIANSNLVPEWATWDEFRRLEELGLTMYGQMTAGSWIYIGTQGIVQGTYECFAEIARRQYGGSLAGTITLTAGLGGMGGAQPLAVTMNGGVALCVEVDPRAHRAPHRDALPRRARRRSRRRGRARATPPATRAARSSIGLAANAADVAAGAAARGLRGRHRHRPDERARPARRLRPGPDDARRGRRAAGAATRTSTCAARARRSPRTARRWSASSTAAPRSSTTATACAPRRELGGFERAFAYPGLRARLRAPAVLRGQGPVPLGRAVGRSRRHRRDRSRGARGVPRRRAARALDPPRPRADRLPGAAGAHLLARLRRAPPARACASTRWSQAASWRRRSSSAATTSTRARSPRRTARPRGWPTSSDAIADWPLLNALVNTASGATWVSHPPRRRRRHRPLDPRRHGVRRRRHRRSPRRSSSAC